VRQTVVLLPFHASVLEPDLDLSLGETELVCHFDASTPGEVPVVVELFLEFQRLMPRVRSPCPLAVDSVRSICRHKLICIFTVTNKQKTKNRQQLTL